MVSPSYEADHWSQRAATDTGLERYLRDNAVPYNATKTLLLERLIGDVRGLKLLDYGGGAGYFGLRCATRGANVTLVDPAPAALELAGRLAKKWDVTRRTRTVCSGSIPAFDGERFDVIVLKDVIEHIHDDAALLARCAALQNPGGRLLISTHNQWSLNYVIEGSYHRHWLGENDWCGWDPTHVRFYTPRSITALLRGAGYQPVRWASVFIVPYNLPSWLLFLRRHIEWPQLSMIDRILGTTFPLNRLGWNVLVCAERVASTQEARDGTPLGSAVEYLPALSVAENA
jgi:2-polyprenyl-6-hydroxyphenyl methylase/3-demethylubiquinone-9 3-methyltransferase